MEHAATTAPAEATAVPPVVEANPAPGCVLPAPSQAPPAFTLTRTSESQIERMHAELRGGHVCLTPASTAAQARHVATEEEKEFARLVLQLNPDLFKCVMWYV